MKQISTFFICCIVLLCTGMMSCNFKADVDLSDVDMTTSLNTSLSLPLGSISAKFGDFLGANSFSQISIDEQGRFSFSDTISVSRSFHPINLADYVSKTSSKWYFEDFLDQIMAQLEGEIKQYLEDEINQQFPGLNIEIDLDKLLEQLEYIPIPGGISFDIEFPLTLDLSKLNIDYDYQRVDSLIVDSALFTSTYTFHNIDFDWNSIKNIQLILNENFRTSVSDTIDLIEEGKSFGEPMKIAIDQFNLILMDDPTAESSGDNIVDSVTLKVRFEIESSSPLLIYRNSYIGYDIELDFINFSALFGYFAASSLMQDDVVDKPISSLWKGWDMFDGWVLPVSEPSIKLIVDHAVAVPLAIHLKHLCTKSKDGATRYASFDESMSKHDTWFRIASDIAMNDPLDKRTTDTIVLDYTPEHGNIDELLTINPHTISYAFEAGVDTTSEMKQFRLTKNTDINLKTVLHVPMAFHDSVHITYSDTIDSLNLTQLQLDSLLDDMKMIEKVEDAELHLYVVIRNSIPFDIKGQFTLYDADNKIVQLSTMHDSSIQLAISYPETVTNGVTTTPSVNHMPLLKIKKEDFAALASVKYIIFNAELGNNRDPVALTPEVGLSIEAGITADINAIIDLNKI